MWNHSTPSKYLSHHSTLHVSIFFMPATLRIDLPTMRTYRVRIRVVYNCRLVTHILIRAMNLCIETTVCIYRSSWMTWVVCISFTILGILLYLFLETARNKQWCSFEPLSMFEPMTKVKETV